MSNSNGSVARDDSEEENPSCLYWEKFSFFITRRLSQFFYQLGYQVATHPWRTISLTVFILAVTSLGFFNLQFEQNALKTFVAADSKLSMNTKWLFDTSGETIRDQIVVLRADNVLTPAVFLQAAYITETVMNLTASNKKYDRIVWDDLCLKIPNIYFYTQEDDEDYTESPPDPNSTVIESHPFEAIVDLDSETFCDSFYDLDKVCVQDNLVAMWNLDTDVIAQLTTDDILQALNRTRISPLTGLVTEFVHLLGGVKRNSSGFIVSAETLMIKFLVNNSFTEVNTGESFNIFGNKEWVSDRIHSWEGVFNDKMKELKVELLAKHNISMYYSASRSFFDVSDDLWAESMQRLGLGFVVMFIYLQFVLLKYEWLEIRLFVGTAGLFSVGMAMISGFGIGAAAGFIMSNTQLSIPFIVIGLGVDDMFVIMSSLEKVRKKHRKLSLPEIIGITMEHSGTSISITSLTNVVVFLVGMKTTIPALNSYYFTAAPCIFMTYFFVVTFFVAAVTLDEKRIAARRNFLLPCIIHKEIEDTPEMEEDQKSNLFVKCLEFVFTKFIFTKVGKIVALIPVFVVAINCLFYVSDVKRVFTLTAVINRDSYHHQFLEIKGKFYPNLGYESIVMMGHLNYSLELPKIFQVSDKLMNETNALYDVKTWLKPFDKFVSTFYNKDLRTEVVNETQWKFYLSQFLFSSDGGQYNFNFKFEKPIQCGQPAPDIRISTIRFKFRQLTERDQYMPVKERVDSIIEDAHLDSGDGFAAVWSRIFYYWIPSAVIDAEIFRNLSLGWLAVTICTSLLIADFKMVFWIQCCVLLTMIDVIGFMDRWDLPYDYLTLVALQMAVGLCVDYAVHIGHMFMTIDHPDKQVRALRSVLEIGPAVFHGGISTLLMFGAMATVNSYSSQAFVKIFVLVIIFGLYHGLVFLPIILSWVGPQPYRRVRQEDLPKKSMKQPDIFTINASTNQLTQSLSTSNDTIDIRL